MSVKFLRLKWRTRQKFVKVLLSNCSTIRSDLSILQLRLVAKKTLGVWICRRTISEKLTSWLWCLFSSQMLPFKHWMSQIATLMVTVSQNFVACLSKQIQHFRLSNLETQIFRMSEHKESQNYWVIICPLLNLRFSTAVLLKKEVTSLVTPLKPTSVLKNFRSEKIF